MRKEVKKAIENLQAAILIVKRISEGDTIPDKVREKAAKVASNLEAELGNMNSIINTYTN